MLWEGPWAQPILKLIGATIPIYDDLPDGINGHVSAGSKTYEWGSWGEILEPAGGTQVLARYTDQFYAGKAAAISCKLGRGSVTYVGVDTLDGELEMSLLRSLYTQAETEPVTLRRDLLVDWRDGFWVASNFTSEVQVVPALSRSRLLLRSDVFAQGAPPFGSKLRVRFVTYWKKENRCNYCITCMSSLPGLS